MPTFPRTLEPSRAEEPKVPGGMIHVGDTGVLQVRNATQAGRVWEERWRDLRRGVAAVEELLAYIEWAHATKTILDVVHPGMRGSGAAPLGAGGGTPLIAGASQTGESINTDGWSASVANVVRAGDVIRIAGLNPLFKIVESASSDGLGAATIRVSPPILVGSSPADNAPITRTGCTIRAVVADYTAPLGRPGQFVSGMRVTFREAP